MLHLKANIPFPSAPSESLRGFFQELLPSVDRAIAIVQNEVQQEQVTSLPALAGAATTLLSYLADISPAHHHYPLLLQCAQKLLDLRCKDSVVLKGDLDCVITMICFCLAQTHTIEGAMTPHPSLHILLIHIIVWKTTLELVEKLLSQITRIDDVLGEALVEILWFANPILLLDAMPLLQSLVSLSVKSQTEFGTNIMNMSLLYVLCKALQQDLEHRVYHFSRIDNFYLPITSQLIKHLYWSY